MRRWIVSSLTIFSVSIGLGFPLQASKAEAHLFATGPTLAVGAGVTCVVSDEGFVSCWGIGYKDYWLVPSDLGRVTQLAAGTDHMCALSPQGSVRCWGYSALNALKIPADLGVVVALSASNYNTCALNTLGKVRCWGWFDYNKFMPSNLGKVTQMSLGVLLCVVDDTGTVRCWSHVDNSPALANVPGDLGEVQIVKTSNAGPVACVLKEAGVVKCWGYEGTKYDVPADLGKVIQLYVSSMGVCTVDKLNLIRCWGDDQFYSSSPPSDLGIVRQMSIREYNRTCAVDEYGAVKCWGSAKGTVPSNLKPVLLEPLQFNSTSAPKMFGSTILCSPVVAVIENWDFGVAFEYQWLRDGNPIEGATSSYYVPSGADYQTTLSLLVTGSKSGYMPKAQTSTGQIVGAGDLLQTPNPKIQGNLKVGGTLALTPLTWDPDVTFQYQWLRDGAEIDGANGTSYVLQAKDFGKDISLSVLGSKDCFHPQTKVSAGLAVGAPSPKIEGNPKVGNWLTASSGFWYSGASMSYQWLRNGAAISRATSAKYKLTPADKGKKITIKVTGKKLGIKTISKNSAPLTIK